jgi:glycerol-1-phosphate dehydrogenase [NAD(P)+]
MPAAHGACVGVGCVSILALYEWLLAQDVGSVNTEAAIRGRASAEAVKAEVERSFTAAHLAENAWTEMAAKQPTPDRVLARVNRLKSAWPDVRDSLEARLVPAATMQGWLRACGGPAHPADLGITAAKHAADYRRARMIRRRYTILDLLEDLGWLDRAVEALFSPEGFWGRQYRAAEAPRAGALV